jgi:hypothetical protein
MRTLTTAVLILSACGPGISNGLFAQGSNATVGAGVEAFNATFGKPLKDYGAAKFYAACTGSESGFKWGITLKGEKVTSLQRSACGNERLDEASVKKEVTPMMPLDAKLIRDFRTSDGRTAHEYRSASLGKLFPEADFVTCDAEGRTAKVAAGTFAYAMAKDGRSWNLVLGTCF